MKFTIHNDDAWKAIEKLEDESIGALVTDPPYLINFMGNDWDKLDDNIAGNKDFWKLVMSKMKHGAHGVVFGHSRTHHRVMVALEDAGFEIRDTLMWLYGQGFPKNHNIGKSVDKLQGNNRKVVGTQTTNVGMQGGNFAVGSQSGTVEITEGTSPWEGWGTALKPAYEPIIMVRKPLAKGKTIAKNCASEGVGGINIDESRIGTTEDFSHLKPHQKHFRKDGAGYKGEEEHDHTQSDSWKEAKDKLQNLGRWPANVLLSHHPECEKECVDGCPVKLMDEQSGTSKTGKKASGSGSGGIWKASTGKPAGPTHGDKGGASRYFKQLQDTAALNEQTRFFYQPKVGKKERNFGGGKNTHPTVKPVALMHYLVRLITPEGQCVLDPFMGSGATGMACALLDRDFIGIDMTEEWCDVSKERIEAVALDRELAKKTFKIK